MDNRPIGIFDSGLGGLTALKAVRALLPCEDIVYLADTLRVPYGEKSRDELLNFAQQDISFLKKHNVKAIMIACGTVSSTIDKRQAESFGLPVVGVLNSAVDVAASKTKNSKIGIIATAASIKAGAFKSEILKKKSNAEVFDVACPLFVPLVESGKTDPENAEVKEAVEKYISPLKEKQIDTLILGCTHYPMLSEAIERCIGEIEFVDVGEEAAKKVAQIVLQNGIAAHREKGKCSFFVTGDEEAFKKGAASFLNYDIDEVKKATLI